MFSMPCRLCSSFRCTRSVSVLAAAKALRNSRSCGKGQEVCEACAACARRMGVCWVSNGGWQLHLACGGSHVVLRLVAIPGEHLLAEHLVLQAHKAQRSISSRRPFCLFALSIFIYPGRRHLDSGLARAVLSRRKPDEEKHNEQERRHRRRGLAQGGGAAQAAAAGAGGPRSIPLQRQHGAVQTFVNILN